MKRRLLVDYPQRTATSVWTLPAGTVVEIQQVDEENNKVLVNHVWEYRPSFFGHSEEVKEEAP